MREAKAAWVCAYDLETSRIEPGTPRPLYITAYDGDGFTIDGPCTTIDQLESILVCQFLTEDRRGCKYVAWNGNHFDAYFIAIALCRNKNFVLRPFLTRNHALRGLRITRAGDGPRCKGWEFLDGIAMLGLAGVSLEKFLENFAPDYKKLTGTIDFESGEQFDAANPAHRAYATRDSEGLYHGMQRAQSIMLEHFDASLAVTMGGACIKIFQANIPKGVVINALDPTAEQITRDFVMRGGYCYCVKRYRGPVWKYDLNQAYAAAMRESPLPCGQVIFNPTGVWSGSKAYIAMVQAWNPDNQIPFYYRREINGRIRSTFARDHIAPTWLTSIEIEQLRAEGWRIEVHCSYQWAQTFSMTEYVDRLERLRTTCDGGPNGAIGTMVKATGNHSYGKTVEETAPIEFLISSEQPEPVVLQNGELSSFEPFYGDGDSPIENVWFRFDVEQRDKEYHAVQLGAFITASVRMKVRRAALLAPDAWLYADTDCVMYSRDVTDLLDIDPARYGAWKIEESGREYCTIAKKVYTEMVPADKVPKKRSAKGLNVKKLTGADFSAWFDGTPPEQEQTQRQNFLVVMQGAEMYRSQLRRGTAVEATKTA